MTGGIAGVDEYIERFPTEVRDRLEEVRSLIGLIAPDTGETISYGIPTVTLDHRHVVYFAAWKSHMSLYPVPPGDEELDEAMAPYLAGKGTLRFAHDQPLPIGLIEKVVRRLVERRLEA
jgi:uncharacterized protein YdhG (YjbR/CyaY superfamily)